MAPQFIFLFLFWTFLSYAIKLTIKQEATSSVSNTIYTTTHATLTTCWFTIGNEFTCNFNWYNNCLSTQFASPLLLTSRLHLKSSTTATLERVRLDTQIQKLRAFTNLQLLLCLIIITKKSKKFFAKTM